MEFQVSYFNPQRWCCESATLNMPANVENSAVATGLEKVSFHSNPKERQCQRMLKLPHNCTHLTCWQSNTQNLQARLQQYVNHEFPDVHLEMYLEKSEEPEIKLPTSAGSSKKQVSRKNIFLLYWLCQRLWVCGSQQTVENSERDGNIRPPYLPPEKSVCRSGSNS